jgi:hypothetical protein
MITVDRVIWLQGGQRRENGQRKTTANGENSF